MGSGNGQSYFSEAWNAVAGWDGYEQIGDAFGGDQADAAEYAAKLQYMASQDAIAHQENMFENIGEWLRPYRQQGQFAFRPLRQEIHRGQPDAPTYDGLVDPMNVQADPGYQFQLNQGFDQVQNSAAARGKLGSGGTLKALEDYRQGLASTYVPQYRNQLMALRGQQVGERQQDFQNQLGLNQQKIDNLMNLVNMGQSAAAMQANAGQNTSNAVSNLLGAGASAMGAGQIGAANAQAQGQNQLMQMGTTLAAAYMMSDEREKENIKRVGKTDDGAGVYTYNYKKDPNKLMHMGVMAQEAAKTNPDAVAYNPKLNRLMVNYGAL